MGIFFIDCIRQSIYTNQALCVYFNSTGENMKATYTTQGTCARSIDIELDGEKIKEVKFNGGCKGNTSGLSALLKGMSIQNVTPKLKGIVCRGNTSCPDQLANALEALIIKKAS
jgi:uncharacterized protein (TIGR03905 family)